MSRHTHQAVREYVVGYTGGVATRSSDVEPRAAGGICTVEICECGYERRTNSNGRHEERGKWHETYTSRLIAARRNPSDTLRETVADAGLAVVDVDRHGVALLRQGDGWEVTEVSWRELRAAAEQADARLAAIYGRALRAAEALRPPGTHW